MIVAGMLVAFALVDVDDCGVSELLGELLLVPEGLKEVGDLEKQDRVTSPLSTLAGIASNPGAFPVNICLMAFNTSSVVGGESSSRFTGACGRHSVAESLIVERSLRTLSKCSAHLSRICFFSVSRFAPMMGKDPEN